MPVPSRNASRAASSRFPPIFGPTGSGCAENRSREKTETSEFCYPGASKWDFPSQPGNGMLSPLVEACSLACSESLVVGAASQRNEISLVFLLFVLHRKSGNYQNCNFLFLPSQSAVLIMNNIHRNHSIRVIS
jgi:hypothetical protein